MCPHHPDQTAAQLVTDPTSSANLPEAIVHAEKAQLDFSRSMSYGDYLQLGACRAFPGSAKTGVG